MITECMTLEAQRREHEAHRAQYAATNPEPVIVPALPQPGNILAAVAHTNRVNEDMVKRIAEAQHTTPDFVRNRAQQIAHDSKRHTYADILTAAYQGRFRL